MHEGISIAMNGVYYFKICASLTMSRFNQREFHDILELLIKLTLTFKSQILKVSIFPPNQ